MLKTKSHVVITERLQLQPLTAADFQHMQTMYTNPVVMRYINHGQAFSEEMIKQRVERFSWSWQNDGFGLWQLRLLTTKAVIGYAGFCYYRGGHADLQNDIEIAYMLDLPYWGNGFAYETVVTCVDLAFKQYHFNRVVAIINAKNQASQHIAMKAGFRLMDYARTEHEDDDIYCITANDYSRIDAMRRQRD